MRKEKRDALLISVTDIYQYQKPEQFSIRPKQYFKDRLKQCDKLTYLT